MRVEHLKTELITNYRKYFHCVRENLAKSHLVIIAFFADVIDLFRISAYILLIASTFGFLSLKMNNNIFFYESSLIQISYYYRLKLGISLHYLCSL